MVCVGSSQFGKFCSQDCQRTFRQREADDARINSKKRSVEASDVARKKKKDEKASDTGAVLTESPAEMCTETNLAEMEGDVVSQVFHCIIFFLLQSDEYAWLLTEPFIATEVIPLLATQIMRPQNTVLSCMRQIHGAFIALKMSIEGNPSGEQGSIRSDGVRDFIIETLTVLLEPQNALSFMYNEDNYKKITLRRFGPAFKAICRAHEEVGLSEKQCGAQSKESPEQVNKRINARVQKLDPQKLRKSQQNPNFNNTGATLCIQFWEVKKVAGRNVPVRVYEIEEDAVSLYTDPSLDASVAEHLRAGRYYVDRGFHKYRVKEQDKKPSQYNVITLNASAEHKTLLTAWCRDEVIRTRHQAWVIEYPLADYNDPPTYTKCEHGYFVMAIRDQNVSESLRLGAKWITFVGVVDTSESEASGSESDEGSSDEDSEYDQDEGVKNDALSESEMSADDDGDEDLYEEESGVDDDVDESDNDMDEQ